MPHRARRPRTHAPASVQADAALGTLTEPQRAAVTHSGGGLLVVAGAGTGKTKVLVERIAWLIRQRGVPSQNILALTFTEKAAAELQDRVDSAVPLSSFGPWIGTFHGFCETVLREEAIRIGLDPRFRILAAPEAWLLLKRNLFTLPLKHYRPLGNPTKFVATLVEFFSQAKDQGVTPDALATYAARAEANEAATAAHWRELGQVYRAYVELQRREGVMDFGDLLLETLRLFRDRADVREKYRARYPYIVVDEFQDTNTTQGMLLELLAGADGNPPSPRHGEASDGRSLLVASDDDQAIYAFRGSNVENVLTFRERFPSASIVVLTENFRSPQTLLDHAYRVIQQNNPYRLEVTAGISKRLVSRVPRNRAWGTDTDTPAVEHRHFATEEEELAGVAEEILRLVDRGEASYREIAILMRTNAQATDIVPSLLRRDIPYVTSEARGLLGRPEVKDAVAYFRLLADPTDARALFRLLTHPALGIAEADRARALAALRMRQGVVLPLLTDSTFLGGLTPDSRPGVARVAGLITQHLKNFRTLRPSVVYLEFLEHSGVLKAAVQESEQHPEVLPNLQAFLSYLRSLDGQGADDFLEFFDVLHAAVEGGEGPAAATLPAETDAIRLLTVHGAKGLEFPYVVVVGATADRFPARGRHRPLELPPDLVRESAFGDLEDRAAHVLEERRLFYVALTRAQRGLLLTSSTTSAGSRIRRKPSPFIAEAEIPSRVVSTEQKFLENQLALPLNVAQPPQPPRDNALSLSASKIAEYELCPLKYRYHYVLRIPVPPHHNFSFGTTLHDVLRDVSQAVRDGQQPTVADALRLYEQYWISEGYDSPAHEEARKAAGREALRNYLAAHQGLLTKAPFAVEAPFSLPISTRRLTGRIDRIDRLDDGSAMVTDFKTGEGKMKDASSDIQLSIYALALRRAFGLEPSSLRLSYIETGKEDTTTRTQEADEQTEHRVEAVATQIQAGVFPARPGFHCRFCDFRAICDDAQLS